MKRTQVAALLAGAAILASASLSWGLSVTLEATTRNMLITTSLNNPVNYTDTYSGASAAVNPASIQGPQTGTGAGGFFDGIDATAGASDSNVASLWQSDASATAEFVPAAIGSTPILSDYFMWSTASVQNMYSGTAVSATSSTSIDQSFRLTGTGPATVSLTYDVSYMLTAISAPQDTVGTSYTPYLRVIASLHSNNSNTPVFDQIFTNLIADGTDHVLSIPVLTTTNSNVPANGNFTIEVITGLDTTAPVPEPSTLILAGSGIAGLFLLRRRAKK